jgi:hypothetical protein
MKTKSSAPIEDPETKARREIEEARAESDRTSAMQGILNNRTRRLMRIFGTRPAAVGKVGGFAGQAGMGGGGGSSGGSGVVGSGGGTGGYGGYGGFFDSSNIDGGRFFT